MLSFFCKYLFRNIKGFKKCWRCEPHSVWNLQSKKYVPVIKYTIFQKVYIFDNKLIKCGKKLDFFLHIVLFIYLTYTGCLKISQNLYIFQLYFTTSTSKLLSDLSHRNYCQRGICICTQIYYKYKVACALTLQFNRMWDLVKLNIKRFKIWITHITIVFFIYLQIDL